MKINTTTRIPAIASNQFLFSASSSPQLWLTGLILKALSFQMSITCPHTVKLECPICSSITVKSPRAHLKRKFKISSAKVH